MAEIDATPPSCGLDQRPLNDFAEWTTWGRLGVESCRHSGRVGMSAFPGSLL